MIKPDHIIVVHLQWDKFYIMFPMTNYLKKQKERERQSTSVCLSTNISPSFWAIRYTPKLHCPALPPPIRLPTLSGGRDSCALLHHATENRLGIGNGVDISCLLI